jgi:hypothetical protein
MRSENRIEKYISSTEMVIKLRYDYYADSMYGIG